MIRYVKWTWEPCRVQEVSDIELSYCLEHFTLFCECPAATLTPMLTGVDMGTSPSKNEESL